MAMASRRKHTEKEIEAYFDMLASIRDDDGLQLRLPFKTKQIKSRRGQILRK